MSIKAIVNVRRYFAFLSAKMFPLRTEAKRFEAVLIQLGGTLNRLITAFLKRNCTFRFCALFSISEIDIIALYPTKGTLFAATLRLF